MFSNCGTISNFFDILRIDHSYYIDRPKEHTVAKMSQVLRHVCYGFKKMKFSIRKLKRKRKRPLVKSNYTTIT